MGVQEAGHYLEWTLWLQVLTSEQSDTFLFDVLEPTKIGPEELAQGQPVGSLVPRRSPDNFFADTAHVLHGIDFGSSHRCWTALIATSSVASRLGGISFHKR